METKPSRPRCPSEDSVNANSVGRSNSEVLSVEVDSISELSLEISATRSSQKSPRDRLDLDASFESDDVNQLDSFNDSKMSSNPLVDDSSFTVKLVPLRRSKSLVQHSVVNEFDNTNSIHPSKSDDFDSVLLSSSSLRPSTGSSSPVGLVKKSLPVKDLRKLVSGVEDFKVSPTAPTNRKISTSAFNTSPSDRRLGAVARSSPLHTAGAVSLLSHRGGATSFEGQQASKVRTPKAFEDA